MRIKRFVNRLWNFFFIPEWGDETSKRKPKIAQIDWLSLPPTCSGKPRPKSAVAMFVEGAASCWYVSVTSACFVLFCCACLAGFLVRLLCFVCCACMFSFACVDCYASVCFLYFAALVLLNSVLLLSSMLLAHVFFACSACFACASFVSFALLALARKMFS